MSVAVTGQKLWAINWGVVQTSAGEIRASLTPQAAGVYAAINAHETIHGGALATYAASVSKCRLSINLRVGIATSIRVYDVTNSSVLWSGITVPAITKTGNPWTIFVIAALSFPAANRRLQLQHSLPMGYTGTFLCADLEVWI